MPTRKLKEKNIRKLIKLGGKEGSLVLSVPREIITNLGWREKQRVSVKKIRGGFTVRDYRSRK